MYLWLMILMQRRMITRTIFHERFHNYKICILLLWKQLGSKFTCCQLLTADIASDIYMRLMPPSETQAIGSGTGGQVSHMTRKTCLWSSLRFEEMSSVWEPSGYSPCIEIDSSSVRCKDRLASPAWLKQEQDELRIIKWENFQTGGSADAVQDNTPSSAMSGKSVFTPYLLLFWDYFYWHQFKPTICHCYIHFYNLVQWKSQCLGPIRDYSGYLFVDLSLQSTAPNFKNSLNYNKSGHFLCCVIKQLPCFPLAHNVKCCVVA